jgi:hypothetical protein
LDVTREAVHVHLKRGVKNIQKALLAGKLYRKR